MDALLEAIASSACDAMDPPKWAPWGNLPIISNIFCSNLLVEKFRISHFTCILTHVEDVKQRMEAQVPSLKRRKKLAKQARAARKIMSAYREPNTFDITVLPLGASLPSNGNFEFFFRIPSATEVTRESPSPRCISSAVTTN